MRTMFFVLNPVELLQGFSAALELSLGGVQKHQWRVALIAAYMADELALDAEEKQDLIYTALIHDIGTNVSWKEHLLSLHQQGNDRMYQHAEHGYQLLKESRLFKRLAPYIRHHHDAWNGMGSNPVRLTGEAIPLISRIICLADAIEISVRDNEFIFTQYKQVVEYIQAHSGTIFDPQLVNIFERVSRKEAFWLDIANPFSFQNFFDSISIYGKSQYSIEDIMEIADIWATIVDRNDPFTGKHSHRVADVSEYVARAKGFSEDEVILLRISGLLHDLGKLAVSNEILTKPDKLTKSEFFIIKQHPYYTYQILQAIEGLQIIAKWAAYHHETLDGEGYPFHLGARELSLGSRIVAVADIFTALTERRPYHADFSWGEVRHIMTGMAERGKIDKSLVELLFVNEQELNTLVKKTSGQ
ncbi:HD-GYP domain [Megasphaera cerevisiae DSM 20462]|nr:HD-GYP domain [Megasphaera cerevisiae DSM 20462]